MLACTWCWGRNRGPRPVVCSPQQASLKVHRLPLDSRCMMPENLLCSTFTAATRKQCERYEESRCQSLHDQNTSLSLHIAPDHRREHVTSGTSQRSLASSGTSPASSSTRSSHAACCSKCCVRARVSTSSAIRQPRVEWLNEKQLPAYLRR